MAYFKYELMLKYLGIKASILNPRVESIFDNEFGYQGFYMRYLNLDTNQEELAKVYVDTQRQNYKEFREIYKAANDERSKTLKASLAAKFNIKQKDIFIYASYPVEVINEEISNLRNFRVSDTPDKYYWDVSNFRDLPGMLEFLEVDPEHIKGFENDINYIINFDAKTLAKCGLFYHIFNSAPYIEKMFKEAPLFNEITPLNKLETAFKVLVEQSEGELEGPKSYCIGLQMPYKIDEELDYRKIKKFVFTFVKAKELYKNYFSSEPERVDLGTVEAKADA